MEQAVAQVERLRNFFREHPSAAGVGEARRTTAGRSGELPTPRRRELLPRGALADDFNTPRALAEVFELVGEANRGEVPGAA